MVLTGGQVSDVKGYAPVMAEPGPEPKVLMGDKGYDADAILADLQDRGIAAVIPPKRNRKVQPIIDRRGTRKLLPAAIAYRERSRDERKCLKRFGW